MSAGTAPTRAWAIIVALGFQHVVDAGRFGLLALAGAPIE